jgi:hypothetical protein
MCGNQDAPWAQSLQCARRSVTAGRGDSIAEGAAYVGFSGEESQTGDGRMHPTPLRVDKIGRIVESDLSSTRISAYRRGAGEAQAAGPHPAHTGVAEQNKVGKCTTNFPFRDCYI